MRILILNQAFHPDLVSTAQHATDLALGLARAGHQVAVVCSSRGYDQPGMRFPARETWEKIDIYRVPVPGFGKSSKWRRAGDCSVFMLSCAWRTLRLPRCEVVIALTSPPLISVLGAFLARCKGARLLYWTMDLNPDEAVAAGWLRQNSIVGRTLARLQLYSLRRAARIIALDRFMKDRIVQKGVDAAKITVLAPWSHDDNVRFDAAARERFRRQHGLDGKFVVMYSGNLSPCHPLDTLLAAALKLASHPEIVFLFIGGGSEFRKVQDFAARHHLNSIACLPYQLLEQLSGSLSAADLHVVIMGDSFLGIVHPCKIYNILRVGSPVLYIGPSCSHVSEIPDLARQAGAFYPALHDDVDAVVANILDARQRPGSRFKFDCAGFSQATVLPKMIGLVEDTGLTGC